jgi:hypothetical protein
VTRHACVVLCFTGRRAHEGDDTSVLNRRDRRIGLTVTLYLLALLPALLFHDLGPVLAITGAVACSCLAYIGPGVVYLGIHGGRFLELTGESASFGPVLRKRFPHACDAGASSQAGTTGTREHALQSEGPLLPPKAPTLEKTREPVETTPLVNISGGIGDPEAPSATSLTAILDREPQWWHYIIWHLCGMPLWVRIALTGKRGLRDHIHKMAMKSPYPIRIGDVQYQRLAVSTQSKQAAGPKEKFILHATAIPPGVLLPPSRQGSENTLPRALSQTHSFNGLHSLSSGSINQQIGKAILEQKARTKQTSPEQPLEPDPQAAPAQWSDFVIAIAFMLFGALAFSAGILSIFME